MIKTLAMGRFSLLTQLSIQGLAVIESLQISFSSGFNVITGETGAGKSILIKALDLLHGAKATPETVRKGCDFAVVWAEFLVGPSHPAVKLAQEFGLPLEEDAGLFSLLIRRRIGVKGRSQAWVNDVPITLGALRQLGAYLIDIFGQHSAHRLLDPAEHLRYVDAFLADKRLLKKYAQSLAMASDTFRSIHKTVADYQQTIRDRDYLMFRLRELDEFAPSVEDYDEVSHYCRQANTMEASQKIWQAIVDCLETGAAGEVASRPVWEAAKLLEGLPNSSEEILVMAKEAEQLATRLDELNYQTQRFADGIEFDPERWEGAQNRVAAYQDLCRKMSVQDVDELVQQWHQLRAEMSSLDDMEQRVEAELEFLFAETLKLRKLAEKLSKARSLAARKVKACIETELAQLAMAGALMEVEFLPVARSLPDLSLAGFSQECQDLYQSICGILTELGESGGERAQFMLAANPGESAYALQKVASGGEVSRIMLALKRCLATGADSCLLVFDEIDTGISGKVADQVGIKLKELAQRFQVLCISHLPQVAAYGDTHFLVAKKKTKLRTESSITKLNRNDSLEEIARLLSGTKVTKQSLANAKALMHRATEPTFSEG